MKYLWNIALALLFSAAVIGCGGDNGDEANNDSSAQTQEEKETITQMGSDTMVRLAQKWAEEFGKANPNIVVQVNGGGSGNGIAALIDGRTDIANASRPMKESEIETMKQKNGGLEPFRVSVAKDGITVYVHEGNPVNQLTIAQLRDIYEGKITNWKEVGGKDAKIILYGRENSSGTYEFFKEHVLNKGDFAPTTQTLPGTAQVVDNVTKDPNGIGYGGAAYAKGVKKLKLAGDNGEALEPTEENILSGKYPLARDLYMYFKEAPTGPMKTYIDWVLSDAGQALTVAEGYYPLKAAGASGTAAAPAEAGKGTAAAPGKDTAAASGK